MKLPSYSNAVDWEIELAAVIGRKAKDVPVERALACVAGYTIANDLSARDAMKRAKNPPASPFHYDWVSQKCFDGACPLGPWIVPAAEIPDPGNLGLKLWISGELMQDSNTGRMIFDTAEQIAMLSSRVTLQPGDLVLTGTPAGVGMGRGRFLKPGEKLKLWIERDQAGFDAGLGEVPQHFVLGLSDPLALPVFRERFDIRALARDPLLRARIAVQVNDPHNNPAHFIRSPRRSALESHAKRSRRASSRS